MWQALYAQHLEQASDNLYDLQARFYQYQYKEGNDMKTHIADIKEIAHHLSEVDKAIEERELITKIVCTLRPVIETSSHRGDTTRWTDKQWYH